MYNATTGPANYAALTGPLASQFLGYITGEMIGPEKLRFNYSGPINGGGVSRRTHVDAVAKELLVAEAVLWSKMYHTPVPQNFPASKSISALSMDNTALCHLFMEMGSKTVAYEVDSTNIHVPLRIAFLRGAARQYDGTFLNYASSNFGDSCNYYTQEPDVTRGAKSWYANKYAITDGPSTTWYRKLYYLNYMSGASAIFWEQGLANQWMMPGPGKHPVQLSPMGRATEEFQAFVDRLPDRGEPYTPVGIVLSYGHGYERNNYACKMLGVYIEDKNDLELRELFNVLWYPSGVVEGQPQSPDVQSMPNGIHGNIFDVLVDRPARATAILDYPVVVVGGDAKLAPFSESVVSSTGVPVLMQYLQDGGTLVVNVANNNQGIDPALLGVKLTGSTIVASQWVTGNATSNNGTLPATPYEIAAVDLAGAEVIACDGTGPDANPVITRYRVGAGAVILTLVPHMIGFDERAHPALPWLMSGLLKNGLMPVEVRLPNGDHLSGQIMFQVNKAKSGWVVMLMNNFGVDKTQSGIARVDRTKYVDVVIRTALPVTSAKEYTQPRDLALVTEEEGSATVTTVSVRVHPGDVQIVGLA
jgi:hypothetical protein